VDSTQTHTETGYWYKKQTVKLLLIERLVQQFSETATATSQYKSVTCN